MIQQDFGRYVKSKKSVHWFWVFMSTPGYRFMIFFRLCNKTSKLNPIGLLARIWYKKLQVKFGYQIPFKAKIGKGLFLGHFGNIVVNQGVSIGNNCNIAQGVTLGYVSRGDKKGCPKIGDRVWIGANAVVVGNVSVGNDVLIAPLTFVNFDVPEGATVIGNPGRIIDGKGSAGYIKNLVEN